MTKRVLFKESTIYLFGEALSKGLPFFMLPYLTRKLGADGFGELSYYLMWLALLNVFISLATESVTVEGSNDAVYTAKQAIQQAGYRIR